MFYLLLLSVSRWLVLLVDVTRCVCLDVLLIGCCRSVCVLSCSLWLVCCSLSRSSLVLFGVDFACSCSLLVFWIIVVVSCCRCVLL